MQDVHRYSLMRPPTRTASLDDYMRKPKQRSKLSRELQEYEESAALEKVNDLPVHDALPVIFVFLEAQGVHLMCCSHQSRRLRVPKPMDDNLC